MNIKLVDIFELLVYITSTINLLVKSNILCFINIFAVMIFLILVINEIEKDTEVDEEEE